MIYYKAIYAWGGYQSPSQLGYGTYYISANGKAVTFASRTVVQFGYYYFNWYKAHYFNTTYGYYSYTVMSDGRMFHVSGTAYSGIGVYCAEYSVISRHGNELDYDRYGVYTYYYYEGPLTNTAYGYNRSYINV